MPPRNSRPVARLNALRLIKANKTRTAERICPPRAQTPATFKMPDFAARAKAIFDARQKALAVKAGMKVKP